VFDARCRQADMIVGDIGGQCQASAYYESTSGSTHNTNVVTLLQAGSIRSERRVMLVCSLSFHLSCFVGFLTL
jgi:hypothetical protein